MTTILLVGDIHARDRPPVNCLPTYTDDILDMLAWSAEHARAIHADAVVWSGDVFDAKAPSATSHALVQRMIAAVHASTEHPDQPVPLWIVPGNHDVSHDRIESLPAQPLGVLLKAGAHLLHGWHPTLPLFGVPWLQHWSDPLAVSTAFSGFASPPPSRESRNALIVAHAPIYPPSRVDEAMFDTVPAADIAAAMGHTGSIYYGHIHEDHGVFEVDGVTFANVGALSRGSVHEYNRERTVQVCEWRSDGSTGSGFTPVPVPNARPASEVFALEAVDEAKAAALDFEAFLSAVGTSVLDMASTAGVVAHLRAMTDVPAAVVERAVAFIEEADGAAG